MGSLLEFNDTLKLKRGQGFPNNVTLGGKYRFESDGIRFFHPSPTRVFLVEEIEGKWNFIGQVMVLEQTIDTQTKITKGIFEVSKLYPDDIRRIFNKYEAPNGKGYEEE